MSASACVRRRIILLNLLTTLCLRAPMVGNASSTSLTALRLYAPAEDDALCLVRACGGGLDDGVAADDGFGGGAVLVADADGDGGVAVVAV